MAGHGVRRRKSACAVVRARVDTRRTSQLVGGGGLGVSAGDHMEWLSAVVAGEHP